MSEYWTNCMEKPIKKGLLSIFVLLVSILLLHTQSTIQGVVRNANSGEPLSGANIHTNTSGTITNHSGHFQLSLKPADSTLTVCFVGYDSKFLSLDSIKHSDSRIFITLRPSDNVLNEATITASRFRKSLVESVASVEILKPDLIKAIHATQVSHALERVPGVQMIDAQPNIRGGNGWSSGVGSRVLILVDNMPALQPDAGVPLWKDIPVENVEQIEVIKGPSSALYGSAALNGTINVITGFARNEPITEIAAFQRFTLSPSDESKKWWDHTPLNYGFSILHKRRLGKLDVVGSAFLFNHPESKHYRQQTQSERQRLSLKLRYRISEKTTLHLNTNLNDGSSKNPFLWLNGNEGGYLPFPGTVTESKNFRYFIDPSVVIFDGNNHQHEVRTRYYYVRNTNDNSQSNSSDQKYIEYVLTPYFRQSSFKLTSGVVASFVSSDSELFSDMPVSSENFAVFAQTKKKLSDKLSVAFGSRFEYNKHNTPESFMGVEIPGGKITDDQLILRAGINYQPQTKTSLRASWGQGYRFPTIAERFISTVLGGFFIFPNVTIQPETGWSTELGIKQQFTSGSLSGYADLALFWSEYEDMMEFTFQQVGNRVGLQSQNIGNTRIRGLEFSTLTQWQLFGNPMRIYGGYTYLDPKYKEFTSVIRSSSSVDYNILKYRNKHYITFDLEYLVDKWSFGLSLNATSEQEAIDALLEAFGGVGEYRDTHPYGCQKMNFRLGYQLGKWKVSLYSENFLNEEYTERPGLLAEPRSVGFRMDYQTNGN